MKVETSPNGHLLIVDKDLSKSLLACDPLASIESFPPFVMATNLDPHSLTSSLARQTGSLKGKSSKFKHGDKRGSILTGWWRIQLSWERPTPRLLLYWVSRCRPFWHIPQPPLHYPALPLSLPPTSWVHHTHMAVITLSEIDYRYNRCFRRATIISYRWRYVQVQYR